MPPPAKTTAPNTADPIRQFSLYIENKVGALHDLTVMLAGQGIHILALTVVHLTESAVVRFVVDDPDKAAEVLREHGYFLSETEVLGVEFDTEADLRFVLAALLEAEVNIHYSYPFLTRPAGKPALILHVEDRELGVQALSIRSYRVLGQRDVSR
jgi:hypothetical protein